MNVARLKYEIDSSQAVKAKDNLKAQTRAAKDAVRAQKGLGSTSTRAGRDISAANENIARSTGMITKAYGAMKVAAIAALAALTVAIGGATIALRKFLNASVESQDGQAQLAAAIKSTGGAAGQTMASLNAHAAALQQVTTFGDEVINSAQGLLLTFTEISGDIFPRATRAVLDTAVAMKVDLKSAVIQIGKALNDPVLGMTALSRSGITFTQAQKDLVKAMVKSGNVIGAQTLILKELETQFGGSAKAARGTLGGALKALENAWGDLFELAGPASERLRKSVEDLVSAIADPEFISSVQSIGSALFDAMSASAKAVNFVVKNIGALTDAFTLLAVGALVPRVVALGSAFVTLAGNIGIASTAARGLAAAMAFFGGPIGLSVTGLAAAYLLLKDNQSAVSVATRDSEQAYEANISLLDAAKKSSEGYTLALRNQLAMQLEVAKRNSIVAQNEKNRTYHRAKGFSDATGFEFLPFELAANTAKSDARGAARVYMGLAGQLRQVDANMKKVKSSGDGVAATATKAKEALQNTASGGFNVFAREAQRAAGQVASATDRLGNSVGGIFKGLLDKTTTWKDAALQALTSVLEYSNKINLSGGGSGIFGGGIFQSVVGGLLGMNLPGRAVGGPVSAGSAYLVGERGPEILQMGSSAGHVVPNHRAFGAANYNVPSAPNIIVNVDASGSTAEDAEVIANRVAQVVVDRYDRHILPHRVNQERRRYIGAGG